MKLIKFLKKIRKKIWLFAVGIFLISFILNWLVYQNSGPNFPVIYRSNEFSINFLGSRNFIWIIPILGMIFIFINLWIIDLLKVKNNSEERNLSLLLFFANIGIVILVFLISIQIYFLNK